MLNSAFTSEATAKSAHKAVQLGPRHAKAISELITTVRAALPDDQKIFLKPRSVAQMDVHFAICNLAFGIFEDNKLIACTLLRHLADATDDHNQDNYPDEALKEGSWAVHSVAVHPGHTGKGLMPLLVSHVKAYALSHPSCDSLIAKVNEENDPSKRGFLKSGFMPQAKGFDKTKGYPVVYLSQSTGSGLARDTETTLQLGYDDTSPPSLG